MVKISTSLVGVGGGLYYTLVCAINILKKVLKRVIRKLLLSRAKSLLQDYCRRNLRKALVHPHIHVYALPAPHSAKLFKSLFRNLKSP